MTEPFIDNDAQPAVRGFLHRPAQENGSAIVLTHGAGANCQSRLLTAMANAFAETVLGAAKAHPATGSTASEPRERHSPNGQHSAAPVSPNVGAGLSPSPTAAGSAPLGGGASAPTSQRTKRDTHLSSAHPSAASADACADSSSVNPNDNVSHEGPNEDNTEELALVGTGSTNRRSN